MSENKLDGLRGWLILVGIAVVFTPIKLLVTFFTVFKPIFENGTWEVLTSYGSIAYNPIWAPLLIGEIAFNAALITASIYLVFLFFTKHHFFPKLYIAIVSASLIFIPLDAWVLTKAIPNEPLFDPQTTKEFMRTLIGALIWIPYMLVSKRVRTTFVKK